VMTKRKGFTLIELLVVIAIIGILAAMLFPVFAKARESARRIQCLANVKNIAMAIQMYVGDWDMYWPNENDMRAINYFNTAPGGGGTVVTLPDQCWALTDSNPYLRPAVLLDEYIGNREIWQCPSASLMNGAKFIVPVGRDGYWLNAYFDSPVTWGAGTFGPCYPAYPPGWGGDVTDSFTQNRTASVVGYAGEIRGAKVFVEGIGVNNMEGTNPSRINDAAWFIVCGDRGGQDQFWSMNAVAFPDYCILNYPCCSADWVNCDFSTACGVDWSMLEYFWKNPSYRKEFTRHMGGSNVGFADGHAKFFLAEALLNQTPPLGSDFEGVELCNPMEPNWSVNCGCW